MGRTDVNSFSSLFQNWVVCKRTCHFRGFWFSKENRNFQGWKLGHIHQISNLHLVANHSGHAGSENSEVLFCWGTFDVPLCTCSSAYEAPPILTLNRIDELP